MVGEPETRIAAGSWVAGGARFLAGKHGDCSCHWPESRCHSEVSELHQAEVVEVDTGKVALAAAVVVETTFQEESE